MRHDGRARRVALLRAAPDIGNQQLCHGSEIEDTQRVSASKNLWVTR